MLIRREMCLMRRGNEAVGKLYTGLKIEIMFITRIVNRITTVPTRIV